MSAQVYSDFVVIRDEKVSPFVNFEIILPLFISPPYKKALQDMEFYDKFVDRFHDLSKVRNPAVSKVTV